MSGAQQPAAVVRGEVRGPDGRPVAGARVVITESPVPVPEIAGVTDAEGRFTLFAPAPGEYAFTAHADVAGAPATGSVRVPAPASLESLHAPPSADEVDDDADMSSDDPLPESAPAAPAAEVHLVLTFSGPTGEP